MADISTEEFLKSVPPSWHLIHVSIPLASYEDATTLTSSISPDTPLRSPSLIRRHISISSSSVVTNDDDARPVANIYIAALTLRQARVATSHLLDDIELVIGAIQELGPGPLGIDKDDADVQVEVGAK